MKIKAIEKYGLQIDKSSLSSYDINNIYSNLTVLSEDTNIPNTLYYYEDNKYVYIPKLAYNMTNDTGFMARDKLEISKSTDIKEYKGNKSLFQNKKMNVEPRNDLQIKTMEFLLKDESPDKSLFLSPGSGKTAMSIMYFVNKKIKPLIIVPDMNLMKQWKDSILQFTNITEKEIFEFEFGAKSFNRKDFNSNYLVYLCCIRTLSSIITKSTIEELKLLHKNIIKENQIDLKIFDECHLNLHAIFKCSLWLPTKYNLTLSGTMNRRLLQENQIHPGIVEPNKCIESVDYEIEPKLMCLLYDSKPNPGNIKYIQDMAMRGGIDFNRYFKYLLSSKHQHKLAIYLAMIENICNKYIYEFKHEYNHKLVIVFPTIQMLDIVYNYLSNKYDVYRMYGIHREKPSNADNFHIVIGTHKLLTAGYDNKALDTMIMPFLFTSQHAIKQLIGRITRSYKNKQYATFIALVDSGFNMFWRYFLKAKNICENDLMESKTLQFNISHSKYKFN